MSVSIRARIAALRWATVRSALVALPRIAMAKRARFVVRVAVLSIGIFAAMPLFQIGDVQGQLQGNMDGWHPVDIENEDQRLLFKSLLCMCGCAHEGLDTCNCNTAHATRLEMKAQLAAGMPIADIQQAYVKQYGPSAWSVPPNAGANTLLWALPLAAIVLGAVGVGVLFKRWQKRSLEAKPAPADGGVPDEYDAKLDQELKELDRE